MTMESGEDEVALVNLAKAGDLEAFNKLVRHYRNALISLSRQIVDEEMARDVAQETLITAYKVLPQLRQPERFGSWLAAIARQKARRLGQRPDTKAFRLDQVIASYLPMLSEQIEVSCSVRDAMRLLGSDLAIVADLYYLQEWSTVDISRFLDLPVSTVKWRLHAARASLRPRLEHLIGDDY